MVNRVDLLGGLMDDTPAAPSAGAGGAAPAGMGGLGGLDDIFGGGAAAPSAPAGPKVVLPADRADGMVVRSEFVAQNGKCFQSICIENNSAAPLSGFAIQYNKNSFGLVPESPQALGQVLPPQIPPGGSGAGMVPLATSGPASDSKGVVQMAIKNNVKVYYFQDACDATAVCGADGRLDRSIFLEQWRSIAQEHKAEVGGLSPAQENVDAVCPRFEAANVFFIARRKLPDGADLVYFSVKTLNGVSMLAEVGFRPGSGTAAISIKAQAPQYVPLLADAITKLLRA